MVAYMQVSLAKCKQLVRAIAPSGNLFLVLTLQELRRQGSPSSPFMPYSGSFKSRVSQSLQLRPGDGPRGL